MKLIIKGMLLFLWGTMLYGQDSLNSKRVNIKTLHYYYQKEWKPLLNMGNQAIKAGIDFKYLRYRMGIAHYELGHYNAASANFSLVERASLQDTILQEYLYYSYLFGGRTADARLYTEKLDQRLKRRLGYQQYRFIDEINLTIGAKFSNKTDSVGHMPFISIGMSHQLGTRFKYTHHFTFLSQNYLGLRYQQYEYYGKAEVALTRGLQLKGAFHYTAVNGNTRYRDSIPIGELTFNRNLQQTGAVGLLGFQGNIGKLRWNAYGAYSSWSTQITTNGSITSTFFPAPPGGFPDTTFIDQELENAWQYGFGVDYRIPFNKTSWLELGGHLSLQHQAENITPIWGVKAYSQLNPKIGIGLEFLQANTTYFLVNDAAFASNAIGTLNAQVGATFNYQLTPRLNWHFNYTYENRRVDNFNFDYHILLTGLKFRL